MCGDDRRPDASQIDLAEFQKLRDEITSRMQLMTTLVVAQLSALGAGISVLDKVPDVLLGLGVISSFLWLLWLDHASQVHKIAAYIGRCLGPRLRGSRPSGLDWERFLRQLDRSGIEAAHALYGDDGAHKLGARKEGKLEFPQTKHVNYYIAGLFGLTPIVLVSIYLVTLADGDFSQGALIARIIGAVAALLLVLTVAAHQYWVYLRAVKNVSDAISAPDPVRSERTGPPEAHSH